MRKPLCCLLLCLLLPWTALAEDIPDTMDVDAPVQATVLNTPGREHCGKENCFWETEKYLGQRASHGCIRVQRKRTEKGVNMRWIWNNIHDKMKTRLVIWEDWAGRTIPMPADDTVLYSNPKGGESYHDSPACYGVLDKYEPMTAFTYGELADEPYASLTACNYCVPPRRPEDIQAANGR